VLDQALATPCSTRRSAARSQPPAAAHVGAEAQVALLLVLGQLGALEEVDLVQVLAAAALVRLQLLLHLRARPAGREAGSALREAVALLACRKISARGPAPKETLKVSCIQVM